MLKIHATVPNPGFRENIDSFIDYIQFNEGKAPSTVKAYFYDLLLFSEYLPSIPITEIKKKNITKAVRNMAQAHTLIYPDGEIVEKRGVGNRTISRRINAMRKYFKYLSDDEDGVLTKNPMKNVKTPVIELKLKDIFTEEQIKMILDHPKNFYDPIIKEKQRELLIIKHNNGEVTAEQQVIDNLKLKKLKKTILLRLAYRTLIRVGEIITIGIEQIDFSEHQIKIHGKGRKDRFVPLDEKTLRLIKRYIKDANLTKEDYLFPNKFGKGYTQPAVIQRYVASIRDDLGFSKFTTHSFRGTGASHLLRNGMDLAFLQDIMGHADPKTTRIYAQTDKRSIKKAVDQYHPLDKLDQD